MANGEWLTITEACKVLRVSRRTLYTYMESGRLSYYQVTGNGHRRIRAEDISKVMIPAISSNGVFRTGVSENIVKELVTQELRALNVPFERDQQERQEHDRELELLRPLVVWAGHPCALCGGALRGVVEPEVARELLKALAHRECLQEREQGRSFPLTFSFLERPLYEAE